MCSAGEATSRTLGHPCLQETAWPPYLISLPAFFLPVDWKCKCMQRHRCIYYMCVYVYIYIYCIFNLWCFSRCSNLYFRSILMYFEAFMYPPPIHCFSPFRFLLVFYLLYFTVNCCAHTVYILPTFSQYLFILDCNWMALYIVAWNNCTFSDTCSQPGWIWCCWTERLCPIPICPSLLVGIGCLSMLYSKTCFPVYLPAWCLCYEKQIPTTNSILWFHSLDCYSQCTKENYWYWIDSSQLWGCLSTCFLNLDQGVVWHHVAASFLAGKYRSNVKDTMGVLVLPPWEFVKINLRYLF